MPANSYSKCQVTASRFKTSRNWVVMMIKLSRKEQLKYAAVFSTAKQSCWHRYSRGTRKSRTWLRLSTKKEEKEWLDFFFEPLRPRHDRRRVGAEMQCLKNSFPWAESDWGESERQVPGFPLPQPLPKSPIRFQPIRGEMFHTTANQVRTHSRVSVFK